jgi:hypothetical protein
VVRSVMASAPPHRGWAERVAVALIPQRRETATTPTGSVAATGEQYPEHLGSN